MKKNTYTHPRIERLEMKISFIMTSSDTEFDFNNTGENDIGYDPNW